MSNYTDKNYSGSLPYSAEDKEILNKLFENPEFATGLELAVQKFEAGDIEISEEDDERL